MQYRESEYLSKLNDRISRSSIVSSGKRGWIVRRTRIVIFTPPPSPEDSEDTPITRNVRRIIITTDIAIALKRARKKVHLVARGEKRKAKYQKVRGDYHLTRNIFQAPTYTPPSIRARIIVPFIHTRQGCRALRDLASGMQGANALPRVQRAVAARHACDECGNSQIGR